jgi:hypothetical protein
MSEFVLVTFPSLRPVRVDGVRLGHTGQILRLETGHHIFDLGKPVDYMPPNVQTPVANTTETTPMVIGFHPAAIAFGGGMAMAPAALPAGKKAGKKKAAKKKGAAKKKKVAAKPKKSAAKRGKRKVR